MRQPIQFADQTAVLGGSLFRSTALLRSLLLAACLPGAAATLHADSIAFVGEDTTTHGSWRTPSVLKPFNPDGANIYGNDGYDLLDASGHDILHNPSGVTVSRVAAAEFPGDAGYTTIDNPAGDGVSGSTILTGTWYDGTADGAIDQYASIHFITAASFMLGIYTDNMDFADISPSSLRIYETVGGSADSGYVTNAVNRTGDWFFFNVTVSAGSTIVVSGVNTYAPNDGAASSDGIGAISFDGYYTQSSSVPEPATMTLFAAGAAMLAWTKHRRTGGSL